MIAAPARAAAIPAATHSATLTGIAGWRARVQGPLSAASIQTGAGATQAASMPSSSAIMPSIMPSPICQKAGSRASRPKGASSSP